MSKVQKWKQSIKLHEIRIIVSAYLKPCESIISKEKYIQSKTEAVVVEGYNSLFRHFFARMRRKTKCVKMLELLMILLMHYRNITLSILN